MRNKHISISNSRTEVQRKVMEQIDKDNVCPFCRKNLDKYHKNPILREGKFWVLTDNQWPYDYIKHQLLAIYKTHIEHISEIDPQSGEELFQFFRDESAKRNIRGGGIAIRFGAPSEHGSYGNTVLHLHAHLIEPDLENLPDEDPKFKFKFGEKLTN